ncbi:MAG TPA: ammonium transporter [Micropruina sp.]|nr:ammonium transporter [Propionibacterium sp.]HMQ37288.1 ammonium transporter [Micropruina sp.]HMR21020.1 ammonium transporter [Micropruina sp.]
MTLLEINSGDTAWILTSAALVLLMTPGLALFYGGMVRAKGVLNMMMMSFISMGVIGVLWVLFGYSMAFGNSVGGAGIIGNPLEFAGLQSLLTNDPEASYPALAFVAFQACFAIITVALVSGAIADRASFGGWTLFAVLWGTLVYFPAAHWVFAFSSDDGSVVGGWIANVVGAVDFAGGTAIHINAGVAALALALVVGPRIGFGTKPMRPHNLTLVMLGAALLWFGWFGFNAGSAVAANGLASLAWVNTLAATAAAMLGWLLVEKLRDGHPTSLGAASGIVAGLVGITPAAGAVSPIGALVIGLAAGVACAYAVGLKYKFGYDDSLDVVGVHLVGGLVGTLLIGFLADPAASYIADPETTAPVAGLFYGGGFDQLWRQAVGALGVIVFSFVMSYLIALVVKYTVGWRVSTTDELGGIDLAEHSEVGYDLSPVYYSSRVHRTLVLSKDDFPATDKTGASK